jgi:stage II sporulation protein D
VTHLKPRTTCQAPITSNGGAPGSALNPRRWGRRVWRDAAPSATNRARTLGLLALSAFVVATLRPASAEEPARDLTQLEVTVRLAEHERELALVTHLPLTVTHARGEETFPPGPWTFRLGNATPAITHYRVFGKTFMPGEEDHAADYMSLWAAKNYTMERITLGSRYKAPSGAIVDTRIYWISFGRRASHTQAEALRKELEADSVWAWIRQERVAGGRGVVTLATGPGKQLGQFELPVVVSAAGPILLKNINTGFWKEKRADQAFAGALTLRVDSGGKLEVLETIRVEDYLEGVLPAEMPAGWPGEALKAQAVAARSEILFNAAKTHALDGFDFCALEHCRAYGADSLRADTTHAAIAATYGEVITHRGLVVPAVFSASCGGWSEDNDAVWSGPPSPALRARPDLPVRAAAGPRSVVAYGTEKWLTTAPEAYCSADATYFRWRRRLTVNEITEHVNKHHRIGAVTDIVMGDRAPGGRLKWVKITGRNGSVTIHKELPIRIAFGGLPSAMVIMRLERSPEGLRAVEVVGGGRGHGVGLCQHGARGMALQGLTYDDILMHYFTGVRIERYHNDGP